MNEKSQKENNESFAYLTLKNGKKTKVDSDIAESLRGRKVWEGSTGRATIYADGKSELLYRFIMKVEKGEIVDHINGDVTDNRRCNLRIVTYLENNQNKHNFRKNKSGFRNVSIDKQSGLWRPSLYSQGKYLFRQRFRNPVIAALVIDRVIKKHSKQPRVKTRGIAASGYARPTTSDNFIYGFTPVELRQKIKKSF